LKISIIVPVYKAEKFIESCIESILKQDYKDFELLLIDDGSPDKSAEICARYVEKDKRIKLFRKENQGPGATRNYGIEKSVGEYITFIDSDDTVDGDFLSNLIVAAETENCALAVNGIQSDIYEGENISKIITYGGENNIYTPAKYIEAVLRQKIPFACYAGPYAKLYLSSVIKEKGIAFPTDIYFGEDEYFNLKYISCLGRESKIVFSAKIGYHYRQINSNSLCSSYYANYYEMISAVKNELCRVFESSGCSKETEKYLTRKYVSSIIGCLFHELEHKDKSPKGKLKSVAKKCCKNQFIKNADYSHLASSKSKMLLFFMKWNLSIPIIAVSKIQYKQLKNH